MGTSMGEKAALSDASYRTLDSAALSLQVSGGTISVTGNLQRKEGRLTPEGGVVVFPIEHRCRDTHATVNDGHGFIRACPEK